MSRAKITLHLVDGDSVSHHDEVTGYVHPVQRVQVLVLSADKKHYLQKEATVNRWGRWSAQCTFGFAESIHQFSVTAIASAPIDGSPFDLIPPGIMKSTSVLVNRTIL